MLHVTLQLGLFLTTRFFFVFVAAVRTQHCVLTSDTLRFEFVCAHSGASVNKNKNKIENQNLSIGACWRIPCDVSVKILWKNIKNNKGLRLTCN